MHAHFAKLCNRLKNVTSKLKILKIKIRKSEKITETFQFYV